MYDPRVIANFMIRGAIRDRRKLTNLALQKLLYLAHAHHCVRFKKPLVSGYFEAWKFGPVMPSLYKELKRFGRNPIDMEFEDIDLFTGEAKDLPDIEDPEVLELLSDVCFHYKKFSAGRLVDVTHAVDGPWHYVWNKSKTDAFADRRISDTVTESRFANLKLSV